MIITHYSRRLLSVTLPVQCILPSLQRRHLGSTRKNSRGGRHFAVQQKEQKEKEAVARIRSPPKDWQKKLPKQQKQEIVIPPAVLAPTFSPYVYIARPALDETVDSTTLFSEAVGVLPSLMAKSDFDYVHPKDLNHEYPKHQVPEVAFLGRSNVGKSSLVNAIMRRNLCRTSKSPGRTQQPYYYGLFPKSLETRSPPNALGYIIDLPGYGFGVSRREVVEGWQKTTQELLIDRRDFGVLKRLFLLIDARREGPTELDITIMKWLEDAEIPYSVVLTKSDRISVPLVVKQVNQLCLRYYASQQAALQMEQEGDESIFVAQSPVIHVTSSKQNWGIHELMLSVETEFVGDDGDDY